LDWFAPLALAITAAGTYSVISFLVSQRISETAIRRVPDTGRGIIKVAMGHEPLGRGETGRGLYLGSAARKIIRSLTDAEATVLHRYTQWWGRSFSYWPLSPPI
jgi:hypothetical protein